MPSIDITSTADTSGIDAASEALAQLDAAAGGSGGGLGDFSSAAGDANSSAGELAGGVQDVSVVMSSGEGSVRAIHSALREFEVAAQEPIGPMHDLNEATGGMAEGMMRVAPALVAAAASGNPAIIAFAGLGAAMELLGVGSQSAGPKINSAASSLVELQSGAQPVPPTLSAGADAISSLMAVAGGSGASIGTFNASLNSTKIAGSNVSASFNQLHTDVGKYDDDLAAGNDTTSDAAHVQADYAQYINLTSAAHGSLSSAQVISTSGAASFGAALEEQGAATVKAATGLDITTSAGRSSAVQLEQTAQTFDNAGASSGQLMSGLLEAANGQVVLAGASGAAGDDLGQFTGSALDASAASAELASSQQQAAADGNIMGSSLMSVVDDLNAATGAAETYGQALQQSQQTEYGGMTPSTNANWGTSPMAVGTGAPALASGAIVTQPTLAWVGEDEPEMVIPFSKMGGAGISPLGSGLGGSGGVNITNTITVYITGAINGVSDLNNAVQNAFRQLYLSGQLRGYGVS